MKWSWQHQNRPWMTTFLNWEHQLRNRVMISFLISYSSVIVENRTLNAFLKALLALMFPNCCKSFWQEQLTIWVSMFKIELNPLFGKEFSSHSIFQSFSLSTVLCFPCCIPHFYSSVARYSVYDFWFDLIFDWRWDGSSFGLLKDFVLGYPKNVKKYFTYLFCFILGFGNTIGSFYLKRAGFYVVKVFLTKHQKFFTSGISISIEQIEAFGFFIEKSVVFRYPGTFFWCWYQEKVDECGKTDFRHHFQEEWTLLHFHGVWLIKITSPLDTGYWLLTKWHEWNGTVKRIPIENNILLHTDCVPSFTGHQALPVKLSTQPIWFKIGCIQCSQKCTATYGINLVVHH